MEGPAPSASGKFNQGGVAGAAGRRGSRWVRLTRQCVTSEGVACGLCSGMSTSCDLRPRPMPGKAGRHCWWGPLGSCRLCRWCKLATPPGAAGVVLSTSSLALLWMLQLRGYKTFVNCWRPAHSCCCFTGHHSCNHCRTTLEAHTGTAAFSDLHGMSVDGVCDGHAGGGI